MFLLVHLLICGGWITIARVGQADHTRRGYLIDRKAVQWMGSILTPHSDEDFVASTIKWTHGPGGWGGFT